MTQESKKISKKNSTKVSKENEYQIGDVVINEKKLITEFKQTKKELEKSKEQIENYIKKNTEDEFKELEKAYQKYYSKIDTLKNSDTYNKLAEKTKENSKKVMKHLQTAIKVFDLKKNEIMNGGGSEQDKQKKIEMVYEYMLEKLFNPEEVKLFKTMRGSSILLLD